MKIQKLPLLQKVYPTQVGFVRLGVFFGYRVALAGSLAISLGADESLHQGREWIDLDAVVVNL